MGVIAVCGLTFMSMFIKYDIVGNRGTDIGYDYPLGRAYESAYLYYLLIIIVTV